MKILKRRVELPCMVRLISDLHIGSPDIDYKALERELYTTPYSRLCINGDVLDLILPKDGKRYTPAGALHKRLWGRDDVINGMIDWGVELLSPIAKYIDFIGDGNHERAVEHNGAINPVKLLIQRLNDTTGSRISYGAYNGFIKYLSGKWNYTIYYHHGASGGSSLASAVSDTIKRMAFVDADAIWLGHRHHRIVSEMRRLDARGKYRNVRLCMSGSYMTPYREGAESYASRKGLPPQGIGGITLKLDTGGGVTCEL